MEKTALVLAGGGARGSYELGVWQALREMDISIHLVTGTSIGAINGSLIAQGDYETAVALWDKLETSHVFDVPLDEQRPVPQKVLQTYKTFVSNFIKSGGTDSNPLKRTLRSYFDEEKIRSSSIDYGVVTIEMDSRKPHELFKADIPRGQMIDYILASASIYPAIRPYVIDGVRYIDGAYYDNLPVKMALERGATRIIAVDLEAFGVVKRETLRLAREVKYIRSSWDLGPTLVFDHDTIRRNIRLGYLDALKAYGAYDGCAYTFLHGVAERLHERLSAALARLFPQKAEAGSLIDKVFRSRVSKFLEERGLSQPSTRDLALVCMELAGEIFELDSTKIYSEEVWLQRLSPQVLLTDLPAASEARQGLWGALRGTTALLNRKVRAKHAAVGIRELLQAPDTAKPPINAAVTPDTFLAGLYLALCDLV